MLIERREAEPSFRGFPRNRLLAALPAADLANIRPQLELVAVRRGTVLQDFQRPQEDVFFIESGLASLQVQTEEDSPVEAGLVGRMGMIGAPVVLGTAHAPIRGVMVISGEALRLSASDLKALMTRSTPLQRLLLRYIHATTVQTSQLVLCNARHDMDQRVARWLLLACDRLDGDEILITHAILGRCLGVRRASVSEALARLKAADAVRAGRGSIVITSRNRVEDLACGCYRVISGEYQVLFKIQAAGEI